MALQALWDVTQQFNNKNGSILTSGKIYIYYRGRTALATSYHDEDGTVVNSNPVLLDNNGRATAFVNPIYSYTIVVCDYYGKELFSQDITLHDAISTAEDVVLVGTDGSVLVDTTQLPNGVQYDLSVNTDIIATKQSVDDVKDDLDDLTVIVNQHTTQIEALQDDVEDLEDALADKKDKQNALEFNGAATKTVKKITQNADGEMDVEFEDIDIKGVQYTTARFPFNSNKIVKIAEIPLYPTFQYQGSGRANLQLLITDSYGSEAIFSLGIIQSGTSSHMVQPKGVFKYIHPGNGRTTYPIKMMHVRPDNASAPMTSATLYLYAEFDESYNQQADWSFKAVINEGSTSSTSKVENAWTFRNTVIAPQADFDQPRSWWYLAPSSTETIPNVEITSEDNSVQVTETTDVQTNTKTFDLSVNVDDALEYGQFRATNVTSLAQLTKIKGNLDLANYLIKLKKGNSYHFTIRGSYVADSAVNTATTISYIEYSAFNTINVNVDNTITDPQYFEISYDIYNYSQNSDYNISFSSMLSGKVSELWVEVHNLNGVSVNGSGVSNIVIAREYNGVLDDTYDGMKIRQTDNGNEIVALRKNNNWYSFGQLAPLSAGADKILITDSNGTVHWGVVGDGLTIDNDTLEVSISGEVSDVVETVEKLSDDLDKKITTTYPFAQITSMSDFAQYGVSNTTRMIGQLFAVPIASEIRKDETLLCVNALQNFSGNVSFGIFEYDFEGNGGTGSTYWIADTGTVSVRAGENEFALKYVLNDAHELQSSKLYYAVIAIAANAPATGLLLGSSSAYAQNVNANPKYTLIVSNMDNYIDWSVGTLQGAWFQGYNEQYDIPRLFMMLRNGEGSTPIPVTEPFTDIGTFTLEHQYRVSDIFSLTPDAEGGVYRKIIPAQDVDIASFRYVDYHGSVSSQTSFPVLLDDTYTPMKAIGDGTWTLGNSDLTKVDGTHFVHEFTFTTPVHLTANTAYWFMVGGNMADQGSEWLITYQTPSVSNDLLLVKNMYNVNSWIIPNSGEFLSSQPGMYLRLSDGINSWTI